MTIFDHYGKLIRQVEEYPPVHRIIAQGDGAELDYLAGQDRNTDPRYWMITKDGIFAVLGETGLVESVNAYVTHNGITITTPLVKRQNAYGYFQVYCDTSLEDILDMVYKSISAMEFRDEDYREIFDWGSQQVLARFGDYQQLYGESDIVPEFTDIMTVVKISEGCLRKCTYCPEPSESGLVLYDPGRIEHNMALARKLQEKHHSEHMYLMTEGFLNTSDILWFHLHNGTDPIEIADLFHEIFPELQKVYTFVGTPTTLRTKDSYLTSLFHEAQRVNRLLLGIESADPVQSRFVGKNETPEQKAEAISKLYNAGFKVKPIVQVGMVGKRFYYHGKWHNSRDGLLRTADWLAQTTYEARARDRAGKVLISMYVPIQGTPLKKQHEDGTVEPFAPHELDAETAWFHRELQSRGVEAELRYETALQRRRRAGYSKRFINPL